jgi:membrane fusion protein, multidrug efflux system
VATPVEATIDETTGEVRERQSSAAPVSMQAADSSQKPAHDASTAN